MRKNKQLPEEECLRLLKEEKRGVLSVVGEDSYPYGMPMNHWYDERDGKIYFHCGRMQGHRLEALKREKKVSFCLYDGGEKAEGEWALTVKSVIVFGRMEIVEDMKRIEDVSARLSRKFTSDKAYIQEEIRKFGKATLLLELTPEHICGKVVTES